MLEPVEVDRQVEQAVVRKHRAWFLVSLVVMGLGFAVGPFRLILRTPAAGQASVPVHIELTSVVVSVLLLVTSWVTMAVTSVHVINTLRRRGRSESDLRLAIISLSVCLGLSAIALACAIYLTTRLL